jgi:predicted aspartyl protease
MRRRSWAPLVLAASIASNQGHATPCSLALNSRVPVREDRTIAVKIDGAPANLMLDTGSSTTVITADAAKRLRLRPDPDTSTTFRGVTETPWSLSGIGGARLGSEVMAKTFEVGALVGRKFHLLSADIPLGAADGLLSTDFLADYDIDLDFPAREIRLFRAYGTCDHAKVFLQAPLYATPLLHSTEDPRPRVAALIDGHRLVALIDTGAQHSSIYAHTAEWLGVNAADEKTGLTLKVHGIGPNPVAAVEHVFPAVTVGDITVSNMRVRILADRAHDDTDMLLGADFQHRLHLWISNSGQALIMQYPPQPSPPLP